MVGDGDGDGDGDGASVAVRFRGREAFITLTSPQVQGVLPALLSGIETHNLVVVHANLSTLAPQGARLHSIRARISDNACLGSEELRNVLEELIVKKIQGSTAHPRF